MNYRVSCHCRRVTFEVNANLDYVVDCNCSICRRRGALWHPATESDLRILTGEADLTLYQFGTARTGKPRLGPSNGHRGVKIRLGVGS